MSPRGWAKATPLPSQEVPGFIPRPGHGDRPAHPCIGRRLPSPLPRGCVWRGAGTTGITSPPMVRGRKSGKRTLPMITGSPLHTGRGPMSFLAPAHSALPSVPGSARLRSKNSSVPGCRWAGSPRLISFMLILDRGQASAPRTSPGTQASLFRKPSAFVELILRGCFAVCPTRSCLKTQGKAGPCGRWKAGGSPR